MRVCNPLLHTLGHPHGLCKLAALANNHECLLALRPRLRRAPARARDQTPRAARRAAARPAGVVGLAVARAVAQAGHEVVILEQAGAIGTGSSSRRATRRAAAGRPRRPGP